MRRLYVSISVVCGALFTGVTLPDEQRALASLPDAVQTTAKRPGLDPEQGKRVERRAARPGVVRGCGASLCDDDGPWPAVGASLFWALWGYKFDRARLEQNLAFLADHGFDYVRVLGEVGGKYWQDRQIDPNWPDYDQAVAGLTDLAYQKYGLRVEWCLFGGVDFSNTPALREARIDRFARTIVGREHEVLLVEIGNESWQNGFPHPEGTAELRALAARLKVKLAEAGAKPLLRAVTSPGAPDAYGAGDELSPYRVTYEGAGADVATVHTDRDYKEEGWRPVWQASKYRRIPGLPAIISNDEPIGPGSSVASEDNPLKLVSQANLTFIAGVAAYTYHTHAGIWGGGQSSTGQPRGPGDLWDFPRAREIAAAFKTMRGYVPPDVVNWTFYDWNMKGHPFEGAIQGHHCPSNEPDCAVAMFAAVKDNQFVAYPAGIRGRFAITAARAATFNVIHPVTGATLQTATLDAGQSLTLNGDPPALFITGNYK